MIQKFEGEITTVFVVLDQLVVRITMFNQCGQAIQDTEIRSVSTNKARDLFEEKCRAFEFVGFTPKEY